MFDGRRLNIKQFIDYQLPPLIATFLMRAHRYQYKCINTRETRDNIGPREIPNIIRYYYLNTRFVVIFRLFSFLLLNFSEKTISRDKARNPNRTKFPVSPLLNFHRLHESYKSIKF